MSFKILSNAPTVIFLPFVLLNLNVATAFVPQIRHSSQPTATIHDTLTTCSSHNYPHLLMPLQLSKEDTVDTDIEERTPEEEAFFAKTKILCSERNIPFQSVKNARDLASVANSPIPPNKLIRTGRLSDATDPEDTHILFDEIGLKTLVDLRSPTELKDDLTLERKEVYGKFVNLVWSEMRGGLVRELNKGEPRIKSKNRSGGGSSGPLHLKNHVKTLVGGLRNGVDAATHQRHEKDKTSRNDNSDTPSTVKYLVAAADLAGVTSETEDDDSALIVQTPSKNTMLTLDTIEEDGGEENDDCNCDDDDDNADCRFVKVYSPGSIGRDVTRNDRKERHFVSLMNELKYVRGTLSKLRKRDIAKVLMKSPGAIVSRRVRANCKDVFLSEINSGGLPMLNELVLSQAAPGIKYVLDLCTDPTRYPIAFYCTAGKDRTGIIAAIILSVLGVPDEDIVEDYSLSANVYAEMNDHKAMVGALSQRNLNAKTFLGAPPHVMSDTLEIIRKEYGNVEGYLDSIGFFEEDRIKLKEALLS